MEELKNRLTEAMTLRGIRATELSRMTGLSKARISQYRSGVYRPKPDALWRLAEALDVSESWLMGQDVAMERTPAGEAQSSCFPTPPNVSPLHLRRYPILGEIACGMPILAEEDREGGYVTAADTHADFCLTARGDSMVDARIFDGDEVFIQQTDTVENGEIAAVVVDNEATLKRLYYYPEEQKVVLKPENPAYSPLTFCGEELNHIHILGRAVAVQGKLR